MTANNSERDVSDLNAQEGTTMLETAPQLDGVDPHTGLLRSDAWDRGRWALVLLGWVAMLLFTFHACTRMVAAGDTWVAMACGRHFTNHGVDTIEPFSANSHHDGPTLDEIKTWPTWAKLMVDVEPETINLNMKTAKEEVSWIKRLLLPKFDLETIRKWHPTGWVNQNWLTHMIFYNLSTKLGSEEEPYYDALVYWKFTLYILTAVAIYYIGRFLGVHPVLAAAATCFALYAGRSLLDVRPAGYSNLLVPVALLVMVLTTYRHHLFIWLLVPITVFWGGAHGGYIYIFIILVPFIGLHVMASLPKRWTSWAYAFLGWLTLYVLCGKLVHHPLLDNVLPILGGKHRFLLVLLGLIGLGLTLTPSIREKQVHLYHALASGFIGIFLFGAGMFPKIDYRLTGRRLEIVQDHLLTARATFFGFFIAFLVLGAVLIFAKRFLVRQRPKVLYHMIGTYAAVLVAAIVFNPFHLTNLSHTFIISVSEHAKRWRDVHEWHPAFNWTNPVGTAMPFLVICILGGLVVFAWCVTRYVTHRIAQNAAAQPRGAASEDRGYHWPKLDLALLAVAVLTIYMAIRSRRFIPIAGFVALPVIALWLQQTLTAILQGLHLDQERDLNPSILRTAVGRLIVIGLGYGLVILGLWYTLFWELKFMPIKLFIPVEGNSRFLAPNVSLIFIGLLLPIAGLLVTAMLYFPYRQAWSNASKAEHGIIKPANSIATCVIIAFVLGYGFWVGAKYKRIYLDPWPGDPKYHSVFMRMTASYLKPFEACKFLRLNKIEGNMMNYWTEGGAIAFGQEPNPENGRTPLQLFMDGRAQAAYDVKAFNTWSLFWAGGQPMISFRQNPRNQGKQPSAKDWQETAQWLDKALKRRKVWVALVPSKEWTSHFARGLDYASSWRVIFVNNKQKLYVDRDDPRGKKLIDGLFNGETKFPDEFTRETSLGHHKLLYGTDLKTRREGFEHAVKAFKMQPSVVPARMVFLWAKSQNDLVPAIHALAQEFIQDFDTNREQYQAEHGYRLYMDAAYQATQFLQDYDSKRRDTEAVTRHRESLEAMKAEYIKIGSEKKW